MKQLISLLLIPVLFSCHRIHEGTIVEKHVEPQHTYTWYSYHKIGKYGGITIPHHCTVPERYAIEVKGKDSDGDTLVEKFYVPINEFHCECIGDHFNDTLPCERNDGR
jgi:hypothetical protein